MSGKSEGEGDMKKVRIMYFASVREQVGVNEEKVMLPSEVNNVEEMLKWMKTRSPEFNNAFKKYKAIQVALDQQHVTHSTKIKKNVREIAIFPPMTGG